MIKIVFIITGLEVGGAETMLIKLLSLLDRSKFEPVVIALRAGGPLRLEVLRMGVHLIEIGMSGLRGLPGAFFRLRKLGRELRPSLLQGWMYHGNLAALAMRKSAPVLWSIRVTADSRAHEKTLTRTIVRLGAKLSGKARKIIYNSSRSAMQHAALGYATRGSVVISNGFDTSLFAPCPSSSVATRDRFRIPHDAQVVGIVGRYHPIKDHASFLEAARLVLDQRPNTYFLMAGRGLDDFNATVVKQIEQLGLKERCILAGNLGEVQKIYPAMDVHVSSSVSEGFPNVLGEAMSCGVPCVATDAGDSSIVLGDTGIVIQPRRPSDLAAAIVQILSEDENAYADRSARARKRIIDFYSLDSIVAQYQAIFEEVAVQAKAAEPEAALTVLAKERKN